MAIDWQMTMQKKPLDQWKKSKCKTHSYMLHWLEYILYEKWTPETSGAFQ